jgi:ribonuclease HII
MSLEWVEGVAGADEAGRGPLAGPVVCAAVMLPPEFDRSGLNDSKQLSHAQLDLLFDRICGQAIFTIESVSPEEIDKLNILWASLEGMKRALERLRPVPNLALIDGNKVPPGLSIPCEAWVKGDARHACIAAASILAKVTRDRYMIEMGAKYPGYGFEKDYGYPTPTHLAALRKLGPCPIHRRSFGPVRELLHPEPSQGSLFS